MVAYIIYTVVNVVNPLNKVGDSGIIDSMEYSEVDEETRETNETQVDEREDARIEEIEREKAERKERSKEVKAWLTDEEHARTKARIEKVKARAKKDIFRGGIGAKKKRNEQKDSAEEEIPASELVSRFDKISQSAENKVNEIQSILNDHLIENENPINIATKLEDLSLNSAQRQLDIRRLVTDFAKDFTKENFQPEEKINLKIVDKKIREQKRERDFYDVATALTYQNLMAELAYRIAIVTVTLRDFSYNCAQEKEIDKELVGHYVKILSLAFSELVITHDDDCPDDADEYLKAAYQLNNETAEFYEKIKEPVAVIVQKMTELKDFLTEEKNHTKEKDEELKEIIKSVEEAGEEFEAVALNPEGGKDNTNNKVKAENNGAVKSGEEAPKTLDGPARRELKNYIKTDIEALDWEMADILTTNSLTARTLMMLSIGKTRIVDLFTHYNGAKEEKKDLFWKALEAKERYLPEIQNLITALINLYQLENEYEKMAGIGAPLPEREKVEYYYRQYMGLLEIIFRNLTSVATYIYNAISHQSTDIAADGTDGELVQTLGLACRALKEICRSILNEHHTNLVIFIYQKLMDEPKNEDYLYYAEVENQIITVTRKYLPVALMPSLYDTSKSMARASALLSNYDNLNLPPSGIRDAMTEEDKKEMVILITEARAEINHYMSWWTDSGIGAIYSLYDFTIYSPETLIKRAKPKELVTLYLATAEKNEQAKKLSGEEQKIGDEMRELPKTDKNIYPRLNECVDSYEIMLKMFRQFYTFFNQRNTQALKLLREKEDFDKEMMICDKAGAPQIKNVLVNFARSYVRFSKQYILLVQEYVSSLKSLYQGLPDFGEDSFKVLKYVGELFPSVQKMLTEIRTSLKIIQSDQDPMIAKFMKTLLDGMEGCWVGDLDLKSVAIISNNLDELTDRLMLSNDNKISKDEARKLVKELDRNAEPLIKWGEEKLPDRDDRG